jgi:hypothetical protein
MEPPVAVSFESADRRPVGWQVQQRVDFVVNRLMQTHRGQPEEQILDALRSGLRTAGVVPNMRQIQQYASLIAELAPLPPSGAAGRPRP